jgi:hypothetical protein
MYEFWHGTGPPASFITLCDLVHSLLAGLHLPGLGVLGPRSMTARSGRDLAGA